MGQDVEGQRLQRITGQDGAGLAECLVAAGLATAQIIIIHRRQVVVDQRIGVNELDCAGRAIQNLTPAPDGLAAGIDQRRPDAFAAVEYRIAHGPVQAGRVGRSRGQPL